MAPPPEPLLDWRVPYVDVLAMIWVSLVSEFAGFEPGLRLPRSSVLPSPKPLAVVGTPTARVSAAAIAARPEKEKGSLFIPPGTRPGSKSCALQRRCHLDSDPAAKR